MYEIEKSLNAGQIMIFRLKKELGVLHRDEEKQEKTHTVSFLEQITSVITDMKNFEKEILSLNKNEDLLLSFKHQNLRPARICFKKFNSSL